MTEREREREREKARKRERQKGRERDREGRERKTKTETEKDVHGKNAQCTPNNELSHLHKDNKPVLCSEGVGSTSAQVR